MLTIEDLTILTALELIEQYWKNTESFLIAGDFLSYKKPWFYKLNNK